MDVRHGIALLLVACLVKFPLVNEVVLAAQVHLMVVRDLFNATLRIAHNVQEFVEKNISV